MTNHEKIFQDSAGMNKVDLTDRQSVLSMVRADLPVQYMKTTS